MALAIIDIERAGQIYYEMIEGDQRKPYLVFLHEGLGCTAMWKEFPHRLCAATGCPGLIYDRLGYGKSSPLQRERTIHYLHDYALSELPRVLAQLIPNRAYFLVGHSDGGSIALLHAAGKPRGLVGLISEAAHVFVEKETLDGIAIANQAFKAGKLGGLVKYHGDKTGQIFHAWADVWLSPWFRYWNIEYALPSIDCPALIVQGVEDQYGTIAQVDAITGKALQARPFLVEACGHTPHHEQAARILDVMQAFVQQHLA